MQIFFLMIVVESTHWHFRKAFEDGENGICEQVLIEDTINISNNEEYIDIDSFNDDSDSAAELTVREILLKPKE